jgi:hypothetical protein
MTFVSHFFFFFLDTTHEELISFFSAPVECRPFVSSSPDQEEQLKNEYVFPKECDFVCCSRYAVHGFSALLSCPPRPLLMKRQGAMLRKSQLRCISVRTEHFFSEEAMSHTRRVSWAPHTTAKKQGVFAKLARSNLNDPLPASFRKEPFFAEQVEAHRSHHRPDVYIYKYNVSPTHLSLRK